MILISGYASQSGMFHFANKYFEVNKLVSILQSDFV